MLSLLLKPELTFKDISFLLSEAQMNYLSALRDQLNVYGYFSSHPGQHGGGNDDTDTDDEPDYHTSYVSESLNQRDSLMKSTNDELLRNKSAYYDAAITQAPEPLDQNILLNTVIEEDLKQIAKLLLATIHSSEQPLSHFKSSVISICNNNKDKIKIQSEDLEKYTNILKTEGLKCLRNCSVSLNKFNSQTQNQNITDCENMINNIFITYVWSQYNRRNEE